MYKLIDYLRSITMYQQQQQQDEQTPEAAAAAAATAAKPLNDTELSSRQHAKYFKRFLELLPASLALHDSTRVTVAFFAVCGLDVLNALDTLSETTKCHIIDWVYSHQVLSSTINTNKLDDGSSGGGGGGGGKGDLLEEVTKKCFSGFQGSSTLNVKNSNENCGLDEYKWGHLAMTYTGIAILITLGDDLSRLNRRAIIDGVAAVQKSDGSFSASIDGNESDMRFVYCASAICAMLDDWGTVDKLAMAEYIKNSMRYDGGVSQHYEMESHGGTTFCAVAALILSNHLTTVLKESDIERMKRWLIFRQVDGFNGRPNKPVDTCYSFWIGSTLKMLNAFHLTNFEENRNYIMAAQGGIIGGFSKWPGSSPDPFHTYFSLCGLSFINEPGLLEVMPSLNISNRAYKRLQDLHQTWKLNQCITHVRLDIE